MTLKLRTIQNWFPLASQAHWSVAHLAHLCGVSQRTLNRHFLDQYGITPHNWMNEMRHQNAVRLLRAGASIKEIAAESGFKHPTNFSREFKKRWGKTPKELLDLPTADLSLKILGLEAI